MRILIMFTLSTLHNHYHLQFFLWKPTTWKVSKSSTCALLMFTTGKGMRSVSTRTHALRRDEESTFCGFLTRVERKSFSEKCAEQEGIAFGCLITRNHRLSKSCTFFSWKLITLTFVWNSHSKSAQFCSNAWAFPKCSTPECSLGWTNFGVSPVQK